MSLRINHTIFNFFFTNHHYFKLYTSTSQQLKSLYEYVCLFNLLKQFQLNNMKHDYNDGNKVAFFNIKYNYSNENIVYYIMNLRFIIEIEMLYKVTKINVKIKLKMKPTCYLVN